MWRSLQHANVTFSAGQLSGTRSRPVFALRCHLRYHFGMKITIDAAGRLVVPKSLRDQFHLAPGSELEIEPTSDGVIIRPADRGPSLVSREGVLVHHGPQTAVIDIAAFVRQEREMRAQRVGRQQR
jgi:AbrB family looped-hinge helix DNA binding protein